MGPFYDHQVGRFVRPDPVRDRDILLAHARRARAEAMADMFGALYRRRHELGEGRGGVRALRRRGRRAEAAAR